MRVLGSKTAIASKASGVHFSFRIKKKVILAWVPIKRERSHYCPASTVLEYCAQAPDVNTVRFCLASLLVLRRGTWVRYLSITLSYVHGKKSVWSGHYFSHSDQKCCLSHSTLKFISLSTHLYNFWLKMIKFWIWSFWLSCLAADRLFRWKQGKFKFGHWMMTEC